MKHKLRKIIPFIFLAVITMAVVVPSAVLVAPHVVYADPASDKAAADKAAADKAAADKAAADKAAVKPADAAAQSPTKPDSVQLDFASNFVVKAIGAIVEMVINILGMLTVVLIHILILVAGYNGYMDAPAVTTGWIIVRDVANMFFVALILIVSIGSIVNPQKFGGVKQVFRILLYALLVNFSRTIAGIFIDISQLVMLTFVNGFAQAAGGNFVEALGVTKINSIAAGTAALTFGSLIGSYILALFIIVIITVIIAVMVVALVVRVVTLWMLVIMSPLAFALGASDLTKEHYSTWWKKFSAELTTGPIVAFFLWLSLITFQSKPGTTLVGPDGLQETVAKGSEPTKVNCGPIDACDEPNMIRFIVAACMLLMGFGFAKEFSGLGGSLAKSAASKAQGYAKGAQAWAGKKAWGATKTVAGVGLAATGLPRISHRVGDAYTWAKRGIGEQIGKHGGVLGRAVGGAMLTSAGKRDEERLKVAREKTAFYTPEMRSDLLASTVSSTAAEKKAVALQIAKDRDYIKATPDAMIKDKDGNDTKEADEAQRKRYKDFQAAYDMLDQAGRDGDKDSADRAKDIADVRPDIKTKGDETKIKSAGRGATLEDLKKINFGAMGKANRNNFFKGVDPELLSHFREKGASSEEKEFIDEFRRGKPSKAMTPIEKVEEMAGDIHAGRATISTLTVDDLKVPEVALRVSAGDMDEVVEDVLVTPDKRKTLNDTTGKVLGAASDRRADAGGYYTKDIQRAAEGHAISGGGLVKGFRADAHGDFTGPQSAVDQSSYARALEGSNGVRIALETDSKMLANKPDGSYSKVKEELIDKMGSIARLKELKAAAGSDNAKKRLVDAIAQAVLDDLRAKAKKEGEDAVKKLDKWEEKAADEFHLH